ncbi:hypothetical protein BDP81DRAFT_310146 [Colletotrichum phormii]|uniref:Uncharacterized protein n=1 Tax=Colletotrichum phormii TaxID=359342 RepID=A0AAJ0A2Y3_9PEZI|nr:uncharacterized protein BDP81DRAFT_310146 [Colletotrichum phormii]KAK1641523.1 hypothetical protein BDP81DRAFT_310146 [Colletotrichum phormii]
MDTIQPSTDGKAETATTPAHPLRFCFRVKVEEIPGVPLQRSITLANDFLSQNFQRGFTWDSDYIYTPHDIADSGKKWILLDVGKNISTSSQYDDVELEVYRVNIDDNTFNYEKAHYSDIRRYTSIFPWGGRP